MGSAVPDAHPLQRALMAPGMLQGCETRFADPPGLRQGLPARSSCSELNLRTFKPATNPLC